MLSLRAVRLMLEPVRELELIPTAHLSTRHNLAQGRFAVPSLPCPRAIAKA
jgi:hypothetical protein